MSRPRRRVGDTKPSPKSRRVRRRMTALEELKLRPSEPSDGVRGTMAAYIEAMRVGNLAPSTCSTRARDFRLFASWCEERSLQRPVELTRPILEGYQRHLFYYRKANGQPLSVARQSVVVTQLRQYFRWLVRQNILLANPASELELPKQGRRLPRYTLSPAEVEKVLAVPDVQTLVGLRDRTVLEVLWATGMRRSEVAHLLVWDVQWEKGTVFIREGKGMKDRVVPIHARALSWVRRYLDEVRPRFVVSPDEGWLFLTEWATAFGVASLSSSVRRYLDAAGIEAKGSCHLFRHACATAMLEGGADVRFIQELLGHANLETTQVYTRVAISKLKAVYEATHPGAKAALLEELAAEGEKEA